MRRQRQKIKEQQKKQLRKAKQLFRKLTMAAYQSANPNDGSVSDAAVWDDLEGMNDDIELLCDKLDAVELTSLNDVLGGAEAVSEEGGPGNKVNVAALVEVKQCAVETAAGAERQCEFDAFVFGSWTFCFCEYIFSNHPAVPRMVYANARFIHPRSKTEQTPSQQPFSTYSVGTPTARPPTRRPARRRPPAPPSRGRRRSSPRSPRR